MSRGGGDSESTASGNRANIPAYIRHELDIDDGDNLRWQIADDGPLRAAVVQQRRGTVTDFDGHEGDRETQADHDAWGLE